MPKCSHLVLPPIRSRTHPSDGRDHRMATKAEDLGDLVSSEIVLTVDTGGSPGALPVPSTTHTQTTGHARRTVPKGNALSPYSIRGNLPQ